MIKPSVYEPCAQANENKNSMLNKKRTKQGNSFVGRLKRSLYGLSDTILWELILFASISDEGLFIKKEIEVVNEI